MPGFLNAWVDFNNNESWADPGEQIFTDEPVVVLDAVFKEEAMTDGVVSHVVLDLQVMGAMHRRASVERVVNRRVANVLTLGFANQMPVDRVTGKRQMLTHAGQFDTLDIHLATGHRHDMPTEVGLCRVF